MAVRFAFLADQPIRSVKGTPVDKKKSYAAHRSDVSRMWAWPVDRVLDFHSRCTAVRARNG